MIERTVVRKQSGTTIMSSLALLCERLLFYDKERIRFSEKASFN